MKIDLIDYVFGQFISQTNEITLDTVTYMDYYVG